MDPKDAEAHLRKAIEVERQHRKAGASALDRRLGRSKGYVRRLLGGEVQFRVPTLFEIVDALGYEPGEFFLWVFGPTHLRADRFLEKLSRRAETPPILRRVDPLLTLEESPRGARTLDEEESVGRLWPELHRLDRLSYSNPRQARQEMAALLPTLVEVIESHGGPLELLTRCLGLCGVIEYSLMDYPAAACYLDRALRHARRRGDQAAEAETYRWCCRLAASQGDHHAALAFADRARDLAVLLHDLPGIGHALLHQGLIRRRLRDLAEAVRHLQSALGYFGNDDWPLRSLVFQALAMVHVDLDDLKKAKKLCRLAEREHLSKEGLRWWNKGWVRASIAQKENRLADAEADYVKLREVGESQHRSLDAAMACVGLVKVYLRSGRDGEAAAVVRDMPELVARVRPVNQKAGQLLDKLVREARSGKLTSIFLDRVAEELGDALAHRGSTFGV